jgi:hypothetical protein
MNYTSLLLPCFLVLFLASCGPAQEPTGEKEEGKKDSLRLEQTDDLLRVLHGDQTVFDYRITSGMSADLPAHYERTGFFHPIYSPAGQVVTDDFPAGYAHQHGFFTAWTNTTFRDSFVDFWNTHKGLAFVQHEGITDIEQQEDHLSFKAHLAHHSMAHDKLERANSWTVLYETLTIHVHNRSAPFVWDVRSEQTNVTEDTLFLNKHLYGGLGIRGSKHWNAKDTTNFMGLADFLTSEGLARDSANHTRPEWTAIYGDLPGGKAGMAVIPHPENFRWPVPVRVHPDLPYFSVSPVTEAAFFIEPGETYVSRYRVVVFDGEVQAKEIDQLKWE